MEPLARTFLAALMATFSVANIAAAGPFEDAIAVYNRRDYAAALVLFRSLADQGNADAQSHLGTMYHDGLGVPQNYAEAVKWYRKAAEQGDASAQGGLGVMYFGGEGLMQNYGEAVKLFRKAADQGNTTAQNNLGAAYANGQGVRQNFVQAHMWFNLAASGSAVEKEDRNKAIRNLDLVAKKMTRPQIAEAQKLASEWKPGTTSEAAPPTTTRQSVARRHR
jgi:uncharacterized protein